mmetsp:Transcript_20675/g.29700  ORF Transcript_20675/g.29700 Transcript_20675/m.29700 type:complete len:173 (-) Transcript_20675:69-587(-)
MNIHRAGQLLRSATIKTDIAGFSNQIFILILIGAAVIVTPIVVCVIKAHLCDFVGINELQENSAYVVEHLEPKHSKASTSDVAMDNDDSENVETRKVSSFPKQKRHYGRRHSHPQPHISRVYPSIYHDEDGVKHKLPRPYSHERHTYQRDPHREYREPPIVRYKHHLAQDWR